MAHAPFARPLPALARAAAAFAFAVWGSAAFGQVPAPAIVDPKPPAVAELPASPAPAARPNPGTTFHAAPKPLSPDAKTADWPSFLGPNHNLVVPETKILERFPDGGPRAVWEVTKGTGYGAPAVVGDRLVLFHRVLDEEVVDCLKADTGERYWRFAYPTHYDDRYGYSDGPRGSPIVAAGNVYTLGAEGKLHCLDLATGSVRWTRDLRPEFKLRPGFFGLGSTPLAEGNVLIVNVGAVPDKGTAADKGGASPNGPCVAGLDLATGKLLWGAGKDWGMSYASPVPATVHGKRRVFVFAGGETTAREPVTGGLLCLDPATGALDFQFPWRGNRRESVNATTPLVFSGDAGGGGAPRVYVGECYGAGGTVVEITPDFKPKQVWANESFGTHFMTPLAKDNFLYGVDGHGPNDAFLVCVDAATGKEAWRTQPEWKEAVGERNLTMGTYRAHLLTVEGRTLMLGEFGHLIWADLTPKGFVERQRATLFAAGETWTPPVLSKGLLYVAQNTPDLKTRAGPRLVCYDLRAP
jgi:outer membrane protein assembly factor BamB